jgi:drug/metabolite transporter (DMT)-like permease
MGMSFFYVLMMVSFSAAIFLAAEVVQSNSSFRIPDLQSLFSLAALGVLSHALGWFLIANALPKIRASLSGLILLLQPALAFVWDVMFFQRPTTLLNWLGVLIALAAIYLGMSRKSADAD